MCEKEKKDLSIKPSQGDFVANLSAFGGTYIFVNYLYQPKETSNEWHLLCDDYSPDYLVPLYREDQLQEMVKWDWSLICDHYKDGDQYFLKLFENRETDLVWVFNDDSPEKVLLSGVMKEKFGKVWDGEDWISEGK